MAMPIAETPTDGVAATTTTFEIRCPADGHVVGTLVDMQPGAVAELAGGMRAAQPEWEALGPDGRAKHLRNWLGWILDNEARLLGMLQEETGKSSGDTGLETMVAVEVINYYAKHAKDFLADRTVRAHNLAAKTKRLRVFHRPYQLVGQIFPWNYPVGMPMLDVPPALAAGAAVLSKPSEVAPLTWTECVRGWREEIGAPPVLGCATGLGSTGAAVTDVVDMVTFTGSTRTGRKIATAAAERLIPFSLELGGKDAMIVLEDANLDRAVGAAIWGGLFNAGQSCLAVERLYVHEAVYESFVGKLATEVGRLRVGMDRMGALESDFGALANEAQMAIVERHVADALEKGAHAITGGKRHHCGLFFPPTVLVDVDHTMQCMREETFGPTLPIMRVRDDEEAIQLANDSPYGLGGSVWTANATRAELIARRLEAGAVNANNVMVAVFQFGLPFGGWKSSGLGARFGAEEGLLKYCRRQGYVSERLDLKSELHWYPYTKRKTMLTNRMVRLLGAPGWKRRLGGSGG